MSNNKNDNTGCYLQIIIVLIFIILYILSQWHFGELLDNF
nr:MAG TPA: syntaxin-1A [Caudoviricetes sp.]DAL04612.1 MAG TPA: syntaxin-1A [Caudoviricetes sp.]